jgi:putative colanic acid biosynthesis glycosyltransferase WcaI
MTTHADVNGDGRRLAPGNSTRSRPRRVVVHDYSGHPFPVELSRELARRGIEVLHLHCPTYRSGKGELDRRSSDPAHLQIEAVPLRRFDKHAPHRRVLQELMYGRVLARRLRIAGADVVLSGNTPLFAQAVALLAAKRRGSSFVFWVQDITSFAASRYLEGRCVPGARAISALLRAFERALLRASDAVVVISNDFKRVLEEWGLPSDRISVVENWAPLRDLPALAQNNAWSQEHGLAGSKVVLYSGTLGLKHNPELLLALARRLRGRSDTSVVVVSEGAGAELLAAAKRTECLHQLRLLPFQPFARMPEVLGSATLLVAILERRAGAFSVPSKVLTYLCAERPVLAAIPAENLAARVLSQSGAGVVVDPEDVQGFVEAAVSLLEDAASAQKKGQAARAYAVRTFEIEAIADAFEASFETALHTAGARRGGILSIGRKASSQL